MMEKRLFEGQTYDYVALPTFIPGTTQGTTFIFRKDWKKGDFCYGDPHSETNIWLQEQNDEFQNDIHFSKALEYIDGMEDGIYKTRLLGVIKALMGKQEDKDKTSRLIGLLCEIGCWKDKKVRNKSLYNSDFTKYAMRCLYEYGVR